MIVLLTVLWILEGLMFTPASLVGAVDLSRDGEGPLSYGVNTSLQSILLKRAICPCGVRNMPTIAGGPQAVRGEIPWQVVLSANYKWKPYFFCGGTLVSSQYVLTSAHCNHDDLTAVRVFLGSTRLADSYITVRAASSFLSHPNYTPDPLANDIAIIKMSSRVSLSSYIYPACLPQELKTFNYTGVNLQISGWGYTSPQVDIRKNLMKASVKGISNAECGQLSRRGVDPSMLCVISSDKFCSEDDGGPLTFIYKGYTYLVGISSAPKEFGGLPRMYTRVTPFLNWINSQIAASMICDK